MKKYILALDQGTTSSRAIIFGHDGLPVAIAQKEFTQLYPKPGWVEHNPVEIWTSQSDVAIEAMVKAGIKASDVAAIGITNQRETTIVWDRTTGKPIYNAIVWQDRRTAEYCDRLKAEGNAEMIRQKTGLVIDAYFSATKVKWILDNVDGARRLASEGKLAFGNVDTWLVWNLTGGKLHITDVSNASRTMLFNINTLEWDSDLLRLFDIPESVLPEVKPSGEVYGEAVVPLGEPVVISGIAGDQQAALFGQMCVEPGMVKNTYGTGCFMMMNIGDRPVMSKNMLLTTIGWKIGNVIQYALEGSIFIAGAVVQWLRDGLGIIKTSAEVEKLAGSVSSSDGVYFVPAFAGLGAPHWEQHARGTITGITRGTTSAHIARAALDSIAYQTLEVLKAMEKDSGIKISELRVDGGATVNNLLMQFQADILQAKVVRPVITETTALGAAYLAGLATGFWSGTEELKKQWQIDHAFLPRIDSETAARLTAGWERAVNSVKYWAGLQG
ncbi:MAG TPA: glycerol kinase GlpK [Bacteroidales bacterium]|nr:glycerol kinase GlpK [Bacteroidales bacterium]